MTVLVIVESPGKIKKIKEILGRNYIVMASVGHVSDLDPKKLSVDVIGEYPNYKFIPKYTIKSDRKAVVKNIQDAMRQCSDVLLAGDADREGCKICESLAQILKLNNPKRIIFHEITKSAINQALQNVTGIDQNLVDAQQGRRVLDRLVGYKISPLLGNNRSAGRVQSAVLSMIKKKNMEVHTALENVKVHVKVTGDFSKGIEGAVLKTTPIPEEHTVTWVADTGLQYIIKNIKVSQLKQHPPPPYTTSTLQQDGSSILHMNSQTVMSVAQSLYEKGHITYHRTDSVVISHEAIENIKEFVSAEYGEDYSFPRTYQDKKKQQNAQEAHEAIRVTDPRFFYTEDHENGLERKLYEMIWSRTICSQMSPALFDVQKMMLDNGKLIFEATKKVLRFDGFLRVSKGNTDTSEELLDVQENETVTLLKIIASSHLDPIPANYNEATLIHQMEVTGIGRPATYAQSIQTILKRGYIEIKDFKGTLFNLETHTMDTNTRKITKSKRKVYAGEGKKRFYVTQIGQEVLDFLNKHFPMITSIEFTASLEEALDEIANGQTNWQTVCSEFYHSFEPNVAKLSKSVAPINASSNDETILGSDDKGCQYSIFNGKYGRSIKCVHTFKNERIFFFIGINEKDPQPSLEEAIRLSHNHRLLGVHRKKPLWAIQNERGIYLRYGSDKRISVKATDINSITFEACKKLI